MRDSNLFLSIFLALKNACLILNMVDTKSSKLWLINPKGIAI